MSRRVGVPRLIGGALVAIALLGAATPPDDRELLDAVRRGDAAAVRSLLEQGGNVNAAQGDGLSALHLAARDGNLAVTRILIGARANVEAKSRIGGYTPLHLASMGTHATVVRALLEAGADPSVPTTTSGVTPLHLAAGAIGGEAAVRELLERGAPVNARESAAGQTPLMFAASAGRLASVRELLSHGADPALSTEVVDVLRRVAVDRAASERLKEALVQMRQTSEQGTDRVLTAAEEQAAIEAQRAFLSSDAEIAKVLEGFTPNALADVKPLWTTPTGLKSELEISWRPWWETLVGKTGGMTALLHAARTGHVEVVEALLDAGADIDQVSGDGSSALLLATINGQFDLAKRLIERGANPNLRTSTDGVSPLFAALQTQWANYTSHPQPRAHENQQTGYMDVLNALLAAGADPNVRLNTHLWYWEYNTGNGNVGVDITGATPFWRAAFAQDIDAMRTLVAHGADPNIPTRWPEIGMRNGRQQDGRIMDDSGIPRLEGAPNMYPIHAATGGGYLGLGAKQIHNVPDNFLNAVKYLVEEHGADVNLSDSWGYTPLFYAAVRGGNDVIEYLVAKGANVHAQSVLGQSPVDVARGGQAGYFERSPYPETVQLLQSLGAEMKCLNTHFRGTGDYCAGSGQEAWERAGSEAGPIP